MNKSKNLGLFDDEGNELDLNEVKKKLNWHQNYFAKGNENLDKNENTKMKYKLKSSKNSNNNHETNKNENNNESRVNHKNFDLSKTESNFYFQFPGQSPIKMPRESISYLNKITEDTIFDKKQKDF